MRTILLASVVLLLNLSRASAQDAEVPPSFQHAPSSVDLSARVPETATSLHAHRQQHLAQALMATSMTGHILGLAGAGFSLMLSMAQGGIADGGGGSNTAGDLLIGSLVTSGLSLVTFFIGLGLDIDARVQLGNETSLAIGPTGFALTF